MYILKYHEITEVEHNTHINILKQGPAYYLFKVISISSDSAIWKISIIKFFCYQSWFLYL